MDSKEDNQRRPWQEIEPSDQTDPTEHTLGSSLKFLNWHVLGASVRGKKHGHLGEWRDDSYAISRSGPWTILAVADGAGSAALSRVGSRIATNVIVENLIDTLGFIEVQCNLDSHGVTCPQEEQVKEYLRAALVTARQSLFEEAERRKCAVDDLSTTLLTVIHTRCQKYDFIFWINAGDCVFAVFSPDQKCRILCDEDHGTTAGETRFITSDGIMETLEARSRFVAIPAPIQALVLMTDGVADDLYPLPDRLPDLLDGEVVGKGYLTLPEGPSLKGVLHYVTQDIPAEQALTSWLQYDKYGSSYDDRTVVLALNEED